MSIEHEFEDEITCPHCGYKDIDSWEAEDYGNMDCGSCGEPFYFNRDVTVTYSTKKL